MDTTLLGIINTVLDNRSKPTISELKDSDHFRDDIGFDSLDLAELTVRIEAEFDVDVFENGLVNTVEEIKERLMQKA
ncbi:MAG: acyl carrier protein [Balneolaceae bacterium]|nr:acyl carrier protein [Balneolaceae bacterium]